MIPFQLTELKEKKRKQKNVLTAHTTKTSVSQDIKHVKRLYVKINLTLNTLNGCAMFVLLFLICAFL